MHARIVQFVEVLRQNGLRVGTSETLDALEGVAHTGLDSRETLRAVLSATLVKRAQDAEAFERAFHSFFGAGNPSLAEWAFSGTESPEGEGPLPPEASELLRALLANDPSQLLRLLRTATNTMDFSRLQTPLQTGFLSRRLFSGMGGESLPAELAALEASISNHERADVFAEQLRMARARLSLLEQLTRQQVQAQVQARLRPRGAGVLDRPISDLSTTEIASAERAVHRLAERLKTRMAIKLERKRKGTLHVRRTLRQNLSWGALPMRPAFRRRRPARPDVMVLCDVSDSVRNASRMMLLFTYALQSLFTRVRSFIFVAELGEVSDLFRSLPSAEALNAALSGEAISLFANSNYGAALEQFARQHLSSVTRRTTILVLGDGRNNYNPAQEWVLEEMHRRAKRLVWLATEDSRGWGMGDSEMRRYAPHCHRVIPVLTLSDLERVADTFRSD
jgi:uncharacterized protein